MANWLLVERYENYRIDLDEGFIRFGIPESKATLGVQVCSGDTLIFYVSSGRSSFSHVREATRDGLHKLGLAGEYDTGYAYALATKPVLLLPRSQWISIKELQNALSFVRGKDLRRAMRTSIMRLSDADAAVILGAMQRARD